MIIKTAYVENMSVGSISEPGKDNQAIQARFAAVTSALRDEQKKKGEKELSKFVDEFTYASCIMMHAAEASLINQETGEPILNKKGEPVTGWFEPIKDAKGRDSVKWVSPDGIKLYANQNADIFPEQELLKAYKEWVGKPLCKDHVSNTIDGVRGVIVDTYYDPKFKRVHALFALDKKNYPELARKVEAGYAPNVSMGTGVGRSVCTECGNVATASHEFCPHVRARTNEGEINLDLSPIELSIVVVGADPLAKVRKIVASLDRYRAEAAALRDIKGAPLEALAELDEKVEDISNLANSPISQAEIEEFKDFIEGLASFKQGEANEIISALSEMMNRFPGGVGALSQQLEPDELKRAMRVLMNHGEDALREPLAAEFKKRLLGKSTVGQAPSEANKTNSGTDSIFSNYTSQIAANPMAKDLELENDMSFGSNGSNIQIGASFKAKKQILTADELEKMAEILPNMLASIKNTMDSLNSNLPKQTLSKGVGTGEIMSFKDLGNRAKLRANAYSQGTEEPKTYAPMGDVNLREKDKHLDGEELNTKVDNPDQKTKEMLSRASIEARAKGRAEALKAIAEGTALKDSSGKVVAVVGDKGKVTEVKDGVASAQMADDGKAEEKKDEVEKTAEFKSRVRMLVEAAKKAKDKDAAAKAKEKAKEKAEKEKAKAKATKEKEKEAAEKAKAKVKAAKEKMDKKAYPQGTEEPKVYPLMGDPNMRSKDKHMDGEMLNTSVDNPDQKMKEMLKRATVRVKMTKAASADQNRWTVFANDEAVLSYTAEQAFGEALSEVSEDFPGKTNAEVFASADYAKELIRAAKSGALVAQAAEMGLLKDEEMVEEADKAAPAEMDLELDEVPMEADKAEMMPMEEVAPEAALKDGVVAALERLEECMAELRNAVLGNDEGVDNVDIALAPATAAINSKMLKGYAVIDSLASELRNAKTANLANPAIRMSVRAALRDAKAAELETIEVLAELEAMNEADCNDSMMLDDQDLHEVREEISDALESHEEVDHSALLEDIETLQEEIKDLSDSEKADLDEAAEEFKGALSAHDGASYGESEKRAAYRASLVARAAAIETSPMLEAAHSKDTKKMLDTPVMSKADAQKAALEVVSRDPKSAVKKAAAGLDAAIKSGKISVASLDYLVSVAAVDAAAAKYWKEFYGEVDKDFAADLTKDFKKSTASSEDVGIRYKRAFDVASEAQSKGLIEAGRVSLESCVDSLVSGTDANFAAFKSLASKIKAPSKQAGFIPQMGVDPVVKTASAQVDITDARALSKALFDT